MASLNPETNFNVTSERPVVDNSSSGIFDLANAALTQFGKERDAAQRSAGKDNSSLNSAAVEGLKRIRAARREGKDDLARRLELNLITEYTKAGGDVNDGQFEQMAQSITGRPVDSFSFSDEEIQLQNIKESDDYSSALAATLINFPDASPEEREALALSNVAAREGRKAILEQADYNFTNETGQAIISEVNDWTSTVFGAVAAAGQQGQIITLEQADQAILAWEQQKQTLTRPANVSAEAWAPVEERIKATDSLLSSFRNIVEPGNVSAQALSNLYAGIKGAGFPNEDMLLTALSADPEVLLNFGVLNVSDLTSALKSLDTSDGTAFTPGSVRDPSIKDSKIPEYTANETRSPQEIFTVAWDSLKVANAHGDTVVSDPNARENWAGIVARGMDHLAYVTAQGEFVSEDAINGMFNENFYRKIRQVKEVDPELGEALEQRSVLALNQAGLAADRQYRVVRAGSPFDYDVRTNTFSVTEGSVRRALATDGLTDAQSQRFIDVVNDTYNGDYAALMSDRGLSLQDVQTDSGQSWYRVWSRMTEGGRPPEQMRTIATSIFGIANAQKSLAQQPKSNLDPANISGRIDMPSDVRRDTAFLTAVTNTSAALNVDPNHMMRAIHFETAGTFRPDIKNPGSSATGLIQFIESTAQGLGTSTAELRGMDRAEQMAWVERYMAGHLKGIANPGFDHIYLAIHYPAALHKDDSYVLYAANGDRMSRQSYKANANLDSNGDGTVTRGEAWKNAWSRSGGASMPSEFLEANALPVTDDGTPGSQGGHSGALFSSSRPSARPTEVSQPSEVQEAQVQTDTRASELSTKTLAQLGAMGLREDQIPAYNSQSEVEEAEERGEIETGALFLLNGQLVKLP